LPNAAAARRRCWRSTGRNLVKSWGGPGQGYEWPQSNHGIHIDYKGNVWIGGNGEKDAHVLKFTKDGKFLLQVGGLGKNAGSNDPGELRRVAKIWVDPKTNEAYIADGYLNKRVAVIDADTGKMKRYWGAYGNKPDDTKLGNYDPKAPPRSSSATRCTASSVRTTADLRVRPR
jgi:DNA-binding beta-propeller fold protein YncE